MSIVGLHEAEFHRLEAEVAEHNAKSARILGDEEAAKRNDKKAAYHRMRQQNIATWGDDLEDDRCFA